MGDPLKNSGSSRNSKVATAINREKVYKRNLVASGAKPFTYSRVASVSHGRDPGRAIGHATIFILKFAALATVRRVSRSKCPQMWHVLQALQVLCYPPLKWIQQWAPFKGLVKGVQMFSRPLLLLSVATAFSDQSDCFDESSDGSTEPYGPSETHPESSSIHSGPDTRSNDSAPQSLQSENWLMQLHKELENQGITLPERINVVELHRFYAAADGDFSCFLLLVKKTIRWRETYRILSEKELDKWSNVVFWHGFDMEHRPCLILRLGLACTNLQPHQRPRFAQAVISQVEHGILHLVDKDSLQITVLVDCDGLSPLGIPMQMIRSCSLLLRNNFPNRLGHLVVVRLPPVLRVVAQTFIKVLKPATRKKVRIEGTMYHEILPRYFQTFPSFLGGNCSCNICLGSSVWIRPPSQSRNAINNMEPSIYVNDGEDPPLTNLIYQADSHVNDNLDRVLRTAVIGIIMVLAFIASVAKLYKPENRPL